MLIDWFTVGAQALNFVVLVWLMRRFLYGPILAAIDGRERAIAARLADAAALDARASAQLETLRAKGEALERERQSVIERDAAAAEVERLRLLDAARAAASEVGARRRETLRREARELDVGLRRRARHEVFAIARKALEELASRELEGAIADAFAGRLRALDATASAGLAAALRAEAPGAEVRSAFELPAGPRETLQRAVNETFSVDAPLKFRGGSDLVCGVELVVGGQRVGWSIADYLSLLETGVREVLDAEDARLAEDDARPAPAPATGVGPASS